MSSQEVSLKLSEEAIAKNMESKSGSQEVSLKLSEEAIAKNMESKSGSQEVSFKLSEEAIAKNMESKSASTSVNQSRNNIPPMGVVASGMPPPKRHAPSDSPTPPPESIADTPRIPLKEALKQAANAKITIFYSENKADEETQILEIEAILKSLKDPSDAENPLEITEILKVQVSLASKKEIQNLTLFTSWPLIYIKGSTVGGLNELKALKTDYLKEWLRDHTYDLIVIGGGSGGLAAAKEAARLGKKVACLDFVKPSPQGTTWGLGGTCVNFGCIPKKLMHQGSLLGHSIQKFGWKLPEGEIEHQWGHLRDSLQDHIASLNWGYRVQLREKTVTYINSYGEFTGPFEISVTNKKKKVEKITADRFLISTGLRPKYPDIPGVKEYTITSDDLFQLPYSPEKTLCVGASYVSLECAGFLHGFGFDVTVMVRSILLRGFDQDMAERIRKHMKAYGIKFESGVPTKIEQIEEKTDQKAGKYRVFWMKKNEETGEMQEVSEEYNTILMAIGREAMTDDVGLETIGVERAKSKKVLGRREQSTTIPWVYAIGDVLEGTPELTPVAIHAGRVLMRRIFDGANELTEYDQIPTTVFTPLEYGCCGLSEEDAFMKYGKGNIIIYHNVSNPLEYTIPERMDKDHCYLKLICLKNEEEKVVGFHILTPNAGEVTQGFGIALKLAAKKPDFDRLIGIHFTEAESFTTLTLEKKDEDEELKVKQDVAEISVCCKCGNKASKKEDSSTEASESGSSTDSSDHPKRPDRKIVPTKYQQKRNKSNKKGRKENYRQEEIAKIWNGLKILHEEGIELRVGGKIFWGVFAERFQISRSGPSLKEKYLEIKENWEKAGIEPSLAKSLKLL